jgi:hypothetical protein
MFVVALTEGHENAASAEVAASALAEVLSIDAYTARLRAAGPLPRVVFQSPSEDAANEVRGKLRSSGLHAMALDTREIVGRDAMVQMRRWSFQDGALFADEGAPRLLIADVGAIVVFVTNHSVLRSWREVVPAQDGAYEQEREARTRVSERFAYLFPPQSDDRSKSPPWVIGESNAQYGGLGTSMRRTRYENFSATLSFLRERAPRARFDDRFAVHPLTAARVLKVRGRSTPLEETPPHDENVEWVVHLLARWLMRPVGGPYR